MSKLEPQELFAQRIAAFIQRQPDHAQFAIALIAVDRRTSKSACTGNVRRDDMGRLFSLAAEGASSSAPSLLYKPGGN